MRPLGRRLYCLQASRAPNPSGRVVARTSDQSTIQFLFSSCSNTPARFLFQDRFSVDGDIDFITDNDSAAVHCILPTNSKVLAIDLSGSQKTRARPWPLINSILPPGRQPLSQVAYVQRGFTSNSTNCQISRDRKVVLALELNLIARKGDLRMMIHIKK